MDARERKNHRLWTFGMAVMGVWNVTHGMYFWAAVFFGLTAAFIYVTYAQG